ncbi:phosphatase PAP2 family protein [Spirosoma utsteinense]|uniref:phosphatase PAP2 family protein n=1 Tax=Spirosoma utsteinense TaxID=2585773 RepID=UPI00164405E6|nr:phosphatase PAP2 family protein [Spirosoma utsteinense]MBC3787781.1 membrane-associated phospholipid phosphatase [Spirosoma utsteinense]
MRNRLLLLWVWLLLALTAHAQNWDINTLRRANLERNHSLDGLFRGFTESASPVAFGGSALLIGLGYAGHDSVARRKALGIGVSVVGATALTTLLKYAIHRPRPFVTYPDLEPLVSGGSPSFPSGHTTDAFAFATALSLSYPKWYVVVPAYAWAGAVGYSRLHLGVHYPSDVLAGAVVGAGTAFVTHKLNQRLASRGLFGHRLSHRPTLPVQVSLHYYPL